MSDPLNSKMGKRDPQDPGHAKYIRNLPSTDALMRQFLKMESGVDKPRYDRGYTWNFEWCSEDPEKSQPLKVAHVRKLMDGGMTFEEAFDEVARLGGTRSEE